LRKVCHEYDAAYTEENLKAVVAAIGYAAEDALSGSLARDLVSIVVDNASLEGSPPELTPATVTLAYTQFSGFAQQVDTKPAGPKKS
jgi:hypothetical protein